MFVEDYVSNPTKPEKARTTRLTANEVIDRVIEHIRRNGRAELRQCCVYFRPSDGNVCAVGLFLADPSKFAWFQGTVDGLVDMHGVQALVPEARHLPVHFWRALQGLHDRLSNWHFDNTLTKQGHRFVAKLRKDYA